MRHESYGKAIGPPARRCRSVGKMLAKCVSQRPTVVGLRPNALLARLAVAIYSRDAFPSALPRQDSAAVRSRALDDGKMLAKCVPGRQSVASFALHASRKWPRTGKSPVRGSISPPCIQNELALAGYARHASEKPRKQPFGNTPREDLAMKGPLFAAQAPRIMHGAQILPSSDAWPFGDETPSLKDGMLRLFRFGGAGSGILV